MSADSFSTQPPPPRKPHCPHCGADFFSPTPVKCWLCQQQVAPGTSTEAPADDDRGLAERIRLPEPRGDNPGWIVFGILAILLVLGLASAGPGILLVLLILAIPALIRAALAASRQAALGQPLTGLGITSTFLSSVGIVALVGLASFAAFYATCFAVCLFGMQASTGKGGYNTLTVVSVGAGLVPGLLVAFLLFRRLWPRKD